MNLKGNSNQTEIRCQDRNSEPDPDFDAENGWEAIAG